jgi:hypothetical protein
MTRGRLAIHAHFYQPERGDPFGGPVRPDPTAAPYTSWNARIAAECYRPNTERGNLDRISFDVGPTLTGWLAREEPDTLARMVTADRGANAMAQGFHHAILPLASTRDRRTEIRWGLRDFELRYGRRAAGIWLPECAVDMPTLRICAEEGVAYTILAPWQAGTDSSLDTRRPYRVEVGGGHSILVAFYDRSLSTTLSFEPAATRNADEFAQDWVGPRLAAPLAGQASPLVLAATDGELYGHHQRFRDLFLERLTDTQAPGAPQWTFDVTTLGAVLAEARRPAFPIMTINERSSWSCHHGVLRWYGECPDAADGRWKQPLRAALDRLATAIDVITETAAPAGVDFWAARDEYVDVAAGFAPAEEVVERALARVADGAPARAGALTAGAAAPALLANLLAAQSSRLAMFASDAWFWDDPARIEVLQVLRFAAHAARLVDPLAGGRLERRLVEDLGALHSPSKRIDGAALYVQALAEVDQPAPAFG